MKTSIRLLVVLLLVALSGLGASGQTPATGRVMREKLGHSQKILEAILTSNFTLLERESAALAKVTETPAWSVLKGPEYMKQSEAFLKALRELRDAAQGHDLDAAAQRYTALTMTCFGCHRYMKDRRLADR
jgi:cytochrome c556